MHARHALPIRTRACLRGGVSTRSARVRFFNDTRSILYYTTSDIYDMPPPTTKCTCRAHTHVRVLAPLRRGPRAGGEELAISMRACVYSTSVLRLFKLCVTVTRTVNMNLPRRTRACLRLLGGGVSTHACVY